MGQQRFTTEGIVRRLQEVDVGLSRVNSSP